MNTSTKQLFPKMLIDVINNVIIDIVSYVCMNIYKCVNYQFV